MVEQRCVNGELDDSNYSSPLPVIGLYIAGATLVCLLFILLDISSSFRNRWLPCRYFSLNSVTLTLFVVAAKLPVDLTTSMPSVEDQLSKLTGTTLICTCMSFLMPSLGTTSVSDCFSNMTALSIFAITIVVNICIQIHTGVIILFWVEHIIILCCMLLLLIGLWYSHFKISHWKEASSDGIKDHLTKGTTTHQKSNNMLHRLKRCYLYGYNSNPQFVLCTDMGSTYMCSLSFLCSVVLAQAAFQSLFNSKNLELCQGSNSNTSSDYGWSMRIIVFSQIITVFISCFGDIIRNLTLVVFLKLKGPCRLEVKDADAIMFGSPIMKGSFRDGFVFYMESILKSIISLSMLLIALPYACLAVMVIWIHKYKDDEEDIQEFKDLIHSGDFGVDEWSLKKGVKDLKRWIKMNKRKKIYVAKLVSKTPPSQDRLKDKFDSVKPGYTLSCLSIVLVERIATISLPSSLSSSKSLLTKSLNQVFKIIQFVDGKMSSASNFEKEKISKLAEALWISEKFNSYFLPKIVKKSENDEIMFQSQSELDRAITIIEGLKEALPSDFVWDELGVIVDFILQQRPYGSIEELHGYMEQLFVDMLNEFLVQLPKAIYKDIVESRPEECEERVRFAIKLLCKIEKLEGLVRWSFPVRSSITSFITDNEVFNTIGGNVTNGDVGGDHAISMP